MLSAVVEKLLLDVDKCKFRSVAFPTLGTGMMYGFPCDVAAKVMFNSVRVFASRAKYVRNVTFVVYDQDQPAIQVSVYHHLILISTEVRQILSSYIP